MFFNKYNETVKSQLDMNIGCFILETIYKTPEYDLLDAYSVINSFVPAGYIPCRESYLYNCF